MLIGSEGGFTGLWDAQTGLRLRVFVGNLGKVYGVAFAPDGTQALTSSGGNAVVLWDTRSGQQLRVLGGATGLSQAAFSPDGNYVLAGSADRTAWLWAVSTGQVLRQFKGHTGAITAVAFSPDGTQILTGSADSTTRLWDVASNRELRVFAGSPAAITSVAFAPDGKTILTGSFDHTAYLWDAVTGQQLRFFAGHTDAVTAVAFVPDGRRALVGSADKTARLWDVATGQLLRVFTGHTDAITTVAFAPDGRHVLTGSADSTARLWRTDVEKVVGLACTLLAYDFSVAERTAYTIADTRPTCANLASPPVRVVPSAELEVTATPAPVASIGNILRIAALDWPATLDPQKSEGGDELNIELLSYEGLTRLDRDLNTVPAAAEAWAYNQDATAITFRLRADLRYSDGSPLTAQDFVRATYRALDPHAPGSYQTTLEMIKGAAAIISTEVPTDAVRLPALFNALGVQATDERTITFELTRPTPYFHTLASLWLLYPAKDDLVRRGGADWWQNPANQIGNGPFRIVTIDKRSNLIELRANPHYWQGRPKLDGVQFTYFADEATALQAYKRGNVDMLAPDANELAAIKADPILQKEYVEYPNTCTFLIQLNVNRPPFDNKQVRQAFAYGFDRSGFVRDVYKDAQAPTLTWIPPGYPGHDKDERRFAYNPQKGRALLAEAGYPDGRGLPEIRFAYPKTSRRLAAIVEYIVQMYRDSLGIPIIPDPLELQAMLTRIGSNATYPQMNQGAWCADYPDSQNWLTMFWHSRAKLAALYGYQNHDADQLMDAADTEIDSARRAEYYAQAQRIIVDDAAGIIESNSKAIFLVKPYVRGLEFTAQDRGFPGMWTSLLNVTIAR